MTSAAFRKIALGLFAAEEGSHMGHADFRVNGKIFASLPPRPKGWEGEAAMVKLTPEQQRDFVEAAPDAFEPVPGGWGSKGATYVRLRRARVGVVRRALASAWENVCGKELRAAERDWESGGSTEKRPRRA